MFSDVSPSLPITLALASPVSVRDPGTDDVLTNPVCTVSSADFPGFGTPGLGVTSSPGSSLPRGVPSPAPVSDGGGARELQSRAPPDHRWPATPTSTPEWVSSFHSVLCEMRDGLARLSASQSGGNIRRPDTGTSHAVTDTSRIPVRERRLQSGVTLSPSLLPEASPSPCASGVPVLAEGERVHRLTGCDGPFYR